MVHLRILEMIFTVKSRGHAAPVIALAINSLRRLKGVSSKTAIAVARARKA